MIVNNTIFDANVLDIIKELKTQLNINHVNLINKYFDSGQDVMICCPYHKGGQERRPSAGIRKSDGLFHCLACGETHTLPEVISYCLGYNDMFGNEGYKWLCKNFATVQIEDRNDIVLDLSRTNKNDSKREFVQEAELDKFRVIHPYMYERGLTDDIIDFFDIGYDIDSNSITFPVRDVMGNCMFVARRSVIGKRFDLPRGIEKPLYGLHEVYLFSMQQIARMSPNRLVGVSEVYVVEGLFDCLRLWSVGKLAVAGFGCLFNKLQIGQLNRLPVRKLILATDNDLAGLQAREKLRGEIKDKIITEIELPEGRKDVGECTDEELNNLKEVF